MNEPITNRTSLAGFVIAIAGSILFSTKAIIVKLAFANTPLDALTLLTLRMIFSLPFYLLAAWIGTTKSGLPRFTQRQWIIIMFLGLFGYYLSSLFDFVGLQYVSAGLERLILFLYPTFAVLINVFVFKDRINKRQIIALIITYLGIGIAFFGEIGVKQATPQLYWGSFLVFLCAITYSIYIAGSGRMVKQVGPTKFTAYAMLAATAGVFIHFLLAGHIQNLEAVYTYWWYGLLLAILATVIPTFMLAFAMKKIGSNNFAIISAIGPVSTIIQAYFILGEDIFMAQIIGTVLVVIGVLLIGWRGNQKISP